MLKQLETFGECRGKTIMDCAMAYNWTSLCITFTDGSFAILRACEGNYEGDGPYISEEKGFDPYEEWASAAVSAGALTEQELENLREAKRIKRQERNVEWQRREYERLKAIFEKEDKSC